MPLEVDGVVITEVNVDGVAMTSVEIDGVEVFSSSAVIYDFNNTTSNYGLFGSTVSLVAGAVIQFTFRSRVTTISNASGFFYNNTLSTIGFEIATNGQVTITGGTAFLDAAPIVTGDFLPLGGADYVITFTCTAAAEIDEIGRSVNGSLGCGHAIYNFLLQNPPSAADWQWLMKDNANTFFPSIGAVTIPIQGYEPARWVPL